MTQRVRLIIGIGIGAISLLILLAFTGPNPDEELTSIFRRMGGPCLELEQWGLFGWVTVGQTHTLTGTTNGEWHPPQPNPPCQDVDDSLVLVRMPLDASPDSYRICGLSDDRACITFDLVRFVGTAGP